MREGSSILRAKALRAVRLISRFFFVCFSNLMKKFSEFILTTSLFLAQVSSIVEADPEVLCDERVQTAVEGRFCDSAISVREAALELVGRYIASHPEVGLKVGSKQ